MNTVRKDLLWLLPFVAAVALVSVAGGAITAPAIAAWYGDLYKPNWTPPNWLFAPVWSALYLMMAVAAWLVWRARSRHQRVGLAIALWFLQLALNLAWSALFFGLRNPALGLADIALLSFALIGTFLLFWPINRLAGWLLAPYMAWVLYATALNYAIWRMN